MDKKEEKKETKKVTKKAASTKKSTAKKSTVKKDTTKKATTKKSTTPKKTVTKKVTPKKEVVKEEIKKEEVKIEPVKEEVKIETKPVEVKEEPKIEEKVQEEVKEEIKKEEKPVVVKKKSNAGLVFLLILFMLITAGMTIFILFEDKIMDFIKPSNKEETKEVEKEKCEPEIIKEDTSNYQIIKIESDKLEKTQDNNVGTITVGDKSYSVKIGLKDEIDGIAKWNIMLGDKQLSFINISYVAVLDDSFIVIKGQSDGNTLSSIEVYDKNLDKVALGNYYNNVANAFSIISTSGQVLNNVDVNVTANYEDNVIDSKHMILALCTNPRNKNNNNQDYVETLLTFDNGKVTEKEILVVENVFCSTQKRFNY